MIYWQLWAASEQWSLRRGTSLRSGFLSRSFSLHGLTIHSTMNKRKGSLLIACHSCKHRYMCSKVFFPELELDFAHGSLFARFLDVSRCHIWPAEVHSDFTLSTSVQTG
jgi:hypothetical protein